MHSELDEKRARFKQEFTERKVQINDSYERMLRVLDEHIRRHEQYMMHWGHKGNQKRDPGAWQKEDAKAAGDLAAKLNQCGQLYLKVRAEARRDAGKLSLEDEMDLVVQFIRDLAPSNRKRILDQLDEEYGLSS